MIINRCDAPQCFKISYRLFFFARLRSIVFVDPTHKGAFMSLRYFLSCLAMFAVLCFSPFSVSAEDEVDESTVSVREKVEGFTEGFDEASEKHFYALYGSYNIIKVVEDVRTQVEGAVAQCGDANPDIKDKMDSRFKVWDEEISPIMKDANANVKNMTIAQDYAKPREIRKLLKFIDKKRESKNEDIKKYPVTSVEACEDLHDKMDDTQENLAALLQTTLISLPNALLSVEEEDAEKAE